MSSRFFRFDWRHCHVHPSVPSVSICPKCRQAFCPDCSRLASHGYVCPLCGGFCGTTKEQEQTEALARLRGRSMLAEVRTIVTYPLVDPLSYLILSLFVLALNFVMFIGPPLALCFLMAYGFQAMSKVSVGDLGSYQPHIESIEDDLVGPAILALCAAILSHGPWVALVLYQSISNAQEFTLSLFPRNGSLVLWVLVLACLVWRILMLPVALIVAGESKSCLDTLNPLHGFRLLRAMGSTFWETVLIVLILDLARIGAAALFQSVPIAPIRLAAEAFIFSYAYLAMGCALGFAIRKKAPEMGLE